MLHRVREDLPLSELVGPRIELASITNLLGPAARADARIEWITVNGERVDATVAADESQWRVVYGCTTDDVVDWLDVYERPACFDGVAGGRVVVVNGPSGAGKSMLMRALQQIAGVPFVILDEPEHIGTVQPGYLIWRDRAPALHRGYLDAIAALARAGNYVAVPAAGHQQDEFVEAFRDVPMLTIGLTCDQRVLVERERRTGRWGGIAADSAAAHDGWTYDIEFDTTDAPDPHDIARSILDRL
jgi:chloramphenicol 3-O-phosphotransferase